MPNHQCYYCERIFDSKEKLYDHLEVHSKIQRNNEEKSRVEIPEEQRKELDKKLKDTLDKDKSHAKKLARDSVNENNK